MTMRTKKNIDTLSIDDCIQKSELSLNKTFKDINFYAQTSVNVLFYHKQKPHQASISQVKLQKVIVLIPLPLFKNNTNCTQSWLMRSNYDDLDLEEMDINWQIAMTAIKIKKFYKKTVQVKGTKDGTAEASREQTTDEEINHAPNVFTVNNELLHLSIQYSEGILELCPGVSSTSLLNMSSNDSCWGARNVSDESSKFDSKYYKGNLGAGFSFERKPCFVCGSLSHLIKNCDYYEKKMAREAALKSKRVVNTHDRQATPAWNNTNRINKANQFTPRPVNVRPNLSTASNTIKTGRVNVNSGSVHVNAGPQDKSGASRFNTGKQHVNSGSVYVNSVTQIKSAASRVNTGKRYINSGCVHINTARVNRPMSNKPNPKPSQVKFKSQNKYFSKQSSPANRPFSRNTAYKVRSIYVVKGKMVRAVKTSEGFVWRETTPPSITIWTIPDSNVHLLSRIIHIGIIWSIEVFLIWMFWAPNGEIPPGNRAILRLSRTPLNDLLLIGGK
ncbi:hypothetical protein Tco_1016317 [Tanacetum coccineum]|uniref:Uncharacterized protein n=1 Tax=Tanacetum coccineum TaxID=301880 RepID=A0ABQ5FQQ0_9ASTR